MKFDELREMDVVERTAKAIRGRGIEVVIVNSGQEALAKIKELIPAGASIMNGSSTTLKEIGYTEYLKSNKHTWNNLQGAIAAETDPAKQAELRKQSIFADYFLGSVHAIAETGELVIASASGSQLPAFTYTSQNLIWVAGTQKIVPTVADGIQRIREYIFPLENERMKTVGYPGSIIAKLLIIEQEAAMMGRKVRLILVNEKLGF